VKITHRRTRQYPSLDFQVDIDCVSAWGLSHDGRGVPSPEFNDIKGLKGSPRRRWGSIFDQHSQATHFLTKRLPKVATEMALNVLAYNMKRVMMIVGVSGLLEAMQA